MIETLPKLEVDMPRRPWTLHEYHKAAELGLFGPDERLELIYGEVYQKMSPQKSSHFYTLTALYHALGQAFGDGYTVRQQGPVLFRNDSEPEPDISVYRGDWKEFLPHHPNLSDAVLIVEVSDTTLRTDRTLKASLYAEAGVAEYWIVNLNARVLEVYRRPVQTPHKAFAFGYDAVLHYTQSEAVSPLAAGGPVVKVSDLLPPA